MHYVRIHRGGARHLPAHARRRRRLSGPSVRVADDLRRSGPAGGSRVFHALASEHGVDIRIEPPFLRIRNEQPRAEELLLGDEFEEWLIQGDVVPPTCPCDELSVAADVPRRAEPRLKVVEFTVGTIL